MIDRFSRMFGRALRQLRDLRRYAPTVVVKNAGQVNVASQQVKVSDSPDGGDQKQKAWKMTPKLRRFREEYLVDLNGKQAAKCAGYSEKTAGKTASENLTKPDIQREISLKATCEKLTQALSLRYPRWRLRCSR